MSEETNQIVFKKMNPRLIILISILLILMITITIMSFIGSNKFVKTKDNNEYEDNQSDYVSSTDENSTLIVYLNGNNGITIKNDISPHNDRLAENIDYVEYDPISIQITGRKNKLSMINSILLPNDNTYDDINLETPTSDISVNINCSNFHFYTSEDTTIINDFIYSSSSIKVIIHIKENEKWSYNKEVSIDKLNSVCNQYDEEYGWSSGICLLNNRQSFNIEKSINILDSLGVYGYVEAYPEFEKLILGKFASLSNEYFLQTVFNEYYFKSYYESIKNKCVSKEIINYIKQQYFGNSKQLNYTDFIPPILGDFENYYLFYDKQNECYKYGEYLDQTVGGGFWSIYIYPLHVISFNKNEEEYVLKINNIFGDRSDETDYYYNTSLSYEDYINKKYLDEVAIAKKFNISYGCDDFDDDCEYEYLDYNAFKLPGQIGYPIIYDSLTNEQKSKLPSIL